MLCSKLHCQKYFKLKHISYKIWEGTTRVEDVGRTPTQNHISPSLLVYEDKHDRAKPDRLCEGFPQAYSTLVVPSQIPGFSPFAGKSLVLHGSN